MLFPDPVRSELEELIKQASNDGQCGLAASLKTVLNTFELEVVQSKGRYEDIPSNIEDRPGMKTGVRR